MLTPADMERVLEHLDRRLAGIEQKLPTLATGEQVQSLTLATTAQIKTLALVTEALGAATAQGLEDVKQFARTLNEETNDKIGLVADGLADLSRRVDDLPTRQEFRTLSTRVDDIGFAVQRIAKGLSDVGHGVTTLTARLEQKGVI